MDSGIPFGARTPLWGLRAAVFTALALALSAGGQILVTGAPLPLATLGLSALAILPVAAVLTASERGFAAIAAVLVPLELSLNATYNVSQADCPADAQGAALHSAPGLPSLLLCGSGPVHGLFLGPFGPASQAAHAATGLLPAASLTGIQLLLLFGAHITAGLLGAAWLHQGEDAVFRALRAVAACLADSLRLLFFLLAPAASEADRAARPPLPEEPPSPSPWDVLLRTARRRGPPVCAPAL